MVLPRYIAPTDPVDPLLLLPVPSPLPHDPAKSLHLQTVLDQLEALLSGDASNSLPATVVTAQMRLITRNAQSIINAGRVEAARAREDLDQRDTILRGVEYERNRIREEIDRCMEYVPAYTAATLAEQDVFLDAADEQVKAALPAVGSEGYNYAVIIAQLEQELKDIQRREDDVAALTKDRDALIRSKREIKQKMDSLEVWLSDYARSTAAVAAKLKEPLDIAAPKLSTTVTGPASKAPDINITTSSTPEPA